MIASRKGNRGELMVQLPAEVSQAVAGPLAGSGQGAADLVAGLLAEVADLRERLARAEAGLEAVKTVAEATVVTEVARVSVASCRLARQQLATAADAARAMAASGD